MSVRGVFEALGVALDCWVAFSALVGSGWIGMTAGRWLHDHCPMPWNREGSD